MGGAGAQQLDPGYQGFATGLPAGRGPVPLGNGTEGVAQTGGGKRCPWSWWTGAHEPPQPPSPFPKYGQPVSRAPRDVPNPPGAAGPQRALSLVAAPFARVLGGRLARRLPDHSSL